MKKLVALLFLSPAFLMAQSLNSTGNEIIFVEQGTPISAIDGYHMAGSDTNVFSIEQGNSPFNVAPASRRVLITNPDARLEIRNVQNNQVADYFIDVDFASTRVVADLSIQNTNTTADYRVGIEQISHVGFNDIPLEWNISRSGAASSDVHNLVFNWGIQLEPSQIPVKRLFVFDTLSNDWVQLSDANTSVDEFNKTLVYSGYQGELNNTRFMIAQARSSVNLTGNMTNFEWCNGSASDIQSFSVEGTNLTDSLVVKEWTWLPAAFVEKLP